MTQRFGMGVLVTVALSAIACSSSNDASEERVNWDAGRGTSACREWQRAYCERVAQCSTATLATCAHQVQAIACVSDTAATDCATALDAATCATVPSTCGPLEIADAAPATESCNELLTEWCTRGNECGGVASIESCVTQQQTSLDCNKAIGVALGYDACIDKIHATECTGDFPNECHDMILLR
jgi:hypothetical protein